MSDCSVCRENPPPSPAETPAPAVSASPPEPPPEPPAGPSCWVGPDLDESQWARPLGSRELNDLLTLAEGCDLTRADALAAPFGHGADEDVASVPESLKTLAATIRGELLNGLGFTVLTGLPVAELDRRTIAAAYLTLGRLIGGLRSQNASGHLLGHVRNVGADPSLPTTRIYQTNRRQTFHTDSCDAVALLCLAPSLEGGASLLASVEATYREMVARRPDLAARLFEPVATDRRGEVPVGQRPWFEIPVLNWFDGHLTAMYQRQYIDAARRFPEAPTLDADHVAALDLFDAILNDPAHYLSVRFEPGDMQFVNNHALLHDRTRFVDDPARPRHLLRLWMTLPGGRPLPEVFTQRYGSVTVGDRGGIVAPKTELSVTI